MWGATPRGMHIGGLERKVGTLGGRVLGEKGSLARRSTPTAPMGVCLLAETTWAAHRRLDSFMKPRRSTTVGLWMPVDGPWT